MGIPVIVSLLGTGPVSDMGLRHAHAISEIITEADVRMKKLVRTRVFPDFGAIDVYGPELSPLPKEIRVRTHLKKGQKCEVRTRS